MPRKKAYSTAEAASLLDCSAPAVIRWIEEGKMKAYRTPGGHRRILKKDLVAFAQAFGFPLTLEDAMSYRVLIIDDEPEVLDLVKKGLENKMDNLLVETAGDGVSGLIRFGEVKPDLVLLDLKMPGMDGIEVITRLKADPKTSSVKMLVLSGHMSRANKKKLKELGVEEYLTKPFNMADLARQVQSMISA